MANSSPIEKAGVLQPFRAILERMDRQDKDCTRDNTHAGSSANIVCPECKTASHPSALIEDRCPTCGTLCREIPVAKVGRFYKMGDDSAALATRFILWSFAISVAILLRPASWGYRTTDTIQLSFDLLAASVITMIPTLILMKAIGFMTEMRAEAPYVGLYLRAFPSDVNARRVCRWISAALDPAFRFAVLRLPGNEPFFASALKSIGRSLRLFSSFDLEVQPARHNLKARLSAMFSKLDMVVIDARKPSTKFNEEALVAWRALGRERCIFLVDDTLDTSDWTQRLNNYLSEHTGAFTVENPKVLVWPTQALPEHKAFSDAVANVSRDLPAPKYNPAAPDDLELESALPQNFGEKEGCLVSAIFFSVGVAAWFLTVVSGESWWWMLVAIIFANLVLFWAAWTGAVRQHLLTKRLRPHHPPLFGNLRCSAISMAIVLAIAASFTALVLKQEKDEKRRGGRNRTTASLAAIKSGLEQYKEKFGEYPEVPLLVDLDSAEYGNLTVRRGAALMLYQALTGDGNTYLPLGSAGHDASDGVLDPEEFSRSISASFPPQMVDNGKLKPGETGPRLLIDWYGRPFQYQKGSADTVNPTFDLWSFGDVAELPANPYSSSTKRSSAAVRWIKNW